MNILQSKHNNFTLSDLWEMDFPSLDRYSAMLELLAEQENAVTLDSMEINK